MEFLKKFDIHRKGILLAYDHGFEHGIKDFKNNVESANPLKILELCYDTELNGVVLTPGIIYKYGREIEEMGLNVVAKINSKTLLSPNKFFSSLTAKVDSFAVHESVKAVGYTIYFGSPHEQEMISTFAQLRDDAQEYGLSTILWAYIRSKDMDERDIDNIAYAARVGMELGADAIKIKNVNTKDDVEFIAKYVRRTHIFVAGGDKTPSFLEFAKQILSSPATGMIVGRNVWQSENPKEVLLKLKEFI